jgi:antitoxin MazE
VTIKKFISGQTQSSIPLPKVLLQQLGISDEVELEAPEGQLVIRPLQAARQGWEEHFQQMAAAGDDELVDGDSAQTDWETTEWTWS